MYHLTVGRACLDTYLSALTDNDLKALDEGVLGCRKAKAAIVDHISRMYRAEGTHFMYVSLKSEEASKLFDQLKNALSAEQTRRDRAANGFIPLFEAGQV